MSKGVRIKGLSMMLCSILLYALTGCGGKEVSYVLKCDVRQEVVEATDDIMMRIASGAIYKKLKETNQLNKLSGNAHALTLYEMYNQAEGLLHFGVTRHTQGYYPKFSGPYSQIYISFSNKESVEFNSTIIRRDINSFIVSLSDCGDVIDVL